MASRNIVAKELAELFKIISHPDRLRLVEELRFEGRDVNTLAETLNLPQARVSQHLSLMRAHRLVDESRDGRRHLYKLRQPEIADWIVTGLDFINQPMRDITQEDIHNARRLWSSNAQR
ncbi:MAG: metalloregulator ArsR/SmtB family transcription factor [Litorimonas sp.]